MQINERYTQIIVSAVLAGAMFGAGFLFGADSRRSSVPAFIVNSTSTVPVDMGPFWNVWSTLEEKFAPASTTTFELTEQDKMWGAIQGLAASYGDPYTVFFPPVESEAFEQEISGSFGGVGMEIGMQDGYLTIIAPLKGTPADKAGVKAGDRVIAVDGKSVLGLTSDEAITMIRGEIGEPVVVTFMREGVSEPLVKTMVRTKIEIPTVDTKQTKEGVFVISLYNFSAVSPNLFRSALREFVESGSDKLIIDLRNNPGGYLEAAMDMASWFLPSGKVVVTEDFGGKSEPKVYRSKGYDVFTDRLKMAILVNEGSASASEILAGALREHGKAVLIGHQTFGKGSVQELLPITDKTSLKVTVAHWLTPNGNSISNGGLAPDIKVEITPENTKNGADPQLQKAIEYLLSK